MWEHYSPEDFKMRSKIALRREESKRRGDVDVLCGYREVGWLGFVFVCFCLLSSAFYQTARQAYKLD